MSVVDSHDLHSFPTRRSSDLWWWGMNEIGNVFCSEGRLIRRTKTAGSTTANAGSILSFAAVRGDRKSTRLNSSHTVNSYAVFCLKKKFVGDWKNIRSSNSHVL